MLLIAREKGEYFSLHKNDKEAFSALVRYVDDHWIEARITKEATHMDPAKRVDTWFNATQAFYLIAEPSVASQ